jgi:hypothetical protein
MSLTRSCRLDVAGCVAIVLAESIASAQRLMIAPGRFASAPPKWATPEDFDGSFIPIMHTLYSVQELPQVSSINFWSRNGGSTSERGADSPHANFRGINDEHGRLVVVMTHNTDIADTSEREGESREYFERFSPAGYALGVNVVLYAMTH